jgi:hypothetical protein
VPDDADHQPPQDVTRWGYDDAELNDCWPMRREIGNLPLRVRLAFRTTSF